MTDPHPNETWADVGMRRMADRPYLSVWADVDADTAAAELLKHPPSAASGVLHVPGALVAVGGWCAPAGPIYDPFAAPWLRADLPWAWDIDVDRWLFPRTTAVAAIAREAWHRLGLMWQAMRFGDPEPDQ
jgi:hypothetical protein